MKPFRMYAPKNLVKWNPIFGYPDLGIHPRQARPVRADIGLCPFSNVVVLWLRRITRAPMPKSAPEEENR